MSFGPDDLPDRIQDDIEQARDRAEEQRDAQDDSTDTSDGGGSGGGGSSDDTGGGSAGGGFSPFPGVVAPPEPDPDPPDPDPSPPSGGGGSDDSTDDDTGGGSAGGGFAPTPDTDPAPPDPDPDPDPPDPDPTPPSDGDAGGGSAGGGFAPTPGTDPAPPDPDPDPPDPEPPTTDPAPPGGGGGGDDTGGGGGSGGSTGGDAPTQPGDGGANGGATPPDPEPPTTDPLQPPGDGQDPTAPPTEEPQERGTLPESSAPDSVDPNAADDTLGLAFDDSVSERVQGQAREFKTTLLDEYNLESRSAIEINWAEEGETFEANLTDRARAEIRENRLEDELSTTLEGSNAPGERGSFTIDPFGEDPVEVQTDESGDPVVRVTDERAREFLDDQQRREAIEAAFERDVREIPDDAPDRVDDQVARRTPGEGTPAEEAVTGDVTEIEEVEDIDDALTATVETDAGETVERTFAFDEEAQEQVRERRRTNALADLEERNEEIIRNLSGARTAQQQEKQRARAATRENQLPELNEEIIRNLSGARTAQQRVKMQARAPDVEVTRPGVGALNDQQQQNQGPLGGLIGPIFGRGDEIRTVGQETMAPAPGLSGDDLVEATEPGEESNIQFDTGITDDLTRGGILSERPGTNEGLLPGSVQVGSGRSPVGLTDDGLAQSEREQLQNVSRINLSEQGFRTTAQNISDYRDTFEDNDPVTVAGSELPENVLQGLAGAGVEAAAGVAQAPAFADTAVEMATQAPGEVREEGAVDVAQAVGRLGLVTGQETVRSIRENPVESGAAVAGAAAISAGTGTALGRGGRIVRDRVRTVGGPRLDLEDVTQEAVARYQRTGGTEGERFPGAEDPDLYQTDPAEAVRQQADQPEAVQDLFDDDGTILTKALGVEPEGPGRGRAAQGFQSGPGESLEEFDYETPGSFVGPDLSPNFLDVEGRSAGFSLRPGLPDLGSQPTGLLVRTDVENPDADTLDDFNQEMIDRGGDTTAVTKPADEVNPGEVEAIVPPGAEFRDVGGGPLRNLARRLGVGSDAYTVVQGRRVPLRGVVPDDVDADTPPRRFGFDDRAQADIPDGPDTRPAFTGTIDELAGSRRPGTDRPAPIVPADGGGDAPSEATRDVSEPSAPSGGVSGGVSPVGGVTSPTSPVGGSDGFTPGSSGGGGVSEGGPSGPPSDPSGGSGVPGSGGSVIPSDPGGSVIPSDPGEPGPPGDPSQPSDPGPPSDPITPTYGSSTPPSEPGTPPGGPTTPPGGPIIPPDTPDRPRRPDLDLDLDAGDRGRRDDSEGYKERFTIDFLNPFTGERIDTSAELGWDTRDDSDGGLFGSGGLF
ncbi:hypothetical protein [Halosimplex marinum]|uniref:hypothetical protein n=1 Tax=Halosimplex marinum TaxID=3396620 RepID=UPI003F56B59E